MVLYIIIFVQKKSKILCSLAASCPLTCACDGKRQWWKGERVEGKREIIRTGRWQAIGGWK
jgi:hypothetical protein